MDAPDGDPNPAEPPVVQTDRDDRGRFAPHNTLGHRFAPGESGNPAGRTSFGAHASEWLNVTANWSVARLEAVANDPARVQDSAEGVSAGLTETTSRRNRSIVLVGRPIGRLYWTA